MEIYVSLTEPSGYLSNVGTTLALRSGLHFADFNKRQQKTTRACAQNLFVRIEKFRCRVQYWRQIFDLKFVRCCPGCRRWRTHLYVPRLTPLQTGHILFCISYLIEWLSVIVDEHLIVFRMHDLSGAKCSYTRISITCYEHWGMCCALPRLCRILIMNRPNCNCACTGPK